MGKPEDLHTWFFLYDETLRKEGAAGGGAAAGNVYEEKSQYRSCHDVMTGSTSVPNLGRNWAGVAGKRPSLVKDSRTTLGRSLEGEM